MSESRLLTIIKEITDSSYIGDDCAYLEDLGIVVSQDSLVEDVHFRLSWMTPKELGIKSMLVNVSDILASGAVPAYVTVSLSLPKNFGEGFVKEFYDGVNSVLLEYGVKVIGGDLTASDKVMVSVCIIGKTLGRNISSRKNAKVGYKIIVAGNHGSSSAGLLALESGEYDSHFVKSHKAPNLQRDFSNLLATTVVEDYAMMDTSDGLADALYKIAVASGVTLEVDFSKIPYDKELLKLNDYKNLILFGGEDYSLVGVVPEKVVLAGYSVIGTAISPQPEPLVIKYSDRVVKYSSIEEFTYNHF